MARTTRRKPMHRIAGTAATLAAATLLAACGSTVRAADGTALDGGLLLPGTTAGVAATTTDGTGADTVTLPDGTVVDAADAADGTVTLPDGTVATVDPSTVASTGTSGTTGTTGTTGSTGTSTGKGTKKGTKKGASSAGTTATTTANRSPITLGFLTTSMSNADDYGLDTGAALSGSTIIKAVVAGFNKGGGVAGRTIDPVIAKTDTASTSWESDFQAACSAFTQDHKAASVIGYDFVYLESFETCLTKAGVSHLTTATDPGGTEAFSKFPYLSSFLPSYDQRMQVYAAAPIADGFITKSDKIGLLFDSCEHHQTAVQRTLVPALKRAGIADSSIKQVTLSCPRGSSSSSSDAAQIATAVMQFQTAGVTKVLTTDITLVQFASLALKQYGGSYLPGFVLVGGGGSAWDDVAPLLGSLAPTIGKKIREYGFMPSADVSTQKLPAKTAAQNRCIALAKAGGVTLKLYSDFTGAYQVCDGLFLLEAALKKTNGDSSAPAVTAAISKLGTVSSAMLHNGVASFGASRTGVVAYRPAAFDDSCKCLAYTGEARRMP